MNYGCCSYCALLLPWRSWISKECRFNSLNGTSMMLLWVYWIQNNIQPRIEIISWLQILQNNNNGWCSFEQSFSQPFVNCLPTNFSINQLNFSCFNSNFSSLHYSVWKWIERQKLLDKIWLKPLKTMSRRHVKRRSWISEIPFRICTAFT